MQDVTKKAAMELAALARRAGMSERRYRAAAGRGAVIEPVNYHPDGLAHHQTVRVLDGEVARLHRRGKLESAQVGAAERLAALHHACRFADARAVDPARIRVDGGAAAALSERAMEARRRYRAALDVLGDLPRKVVADVVIEGLTLQETAKRRGLGGDRKARGMAALWVLKAGLDVLARHFTGAVRPASSAVKKGG